jgi:Domain of unknown function (DUF4190)
VNRLAAAALTCGTAQLVFGPFTGVPAIVLGHIARGQIRQSGESGNGMAVTGLIPGYRHGPHPDYRRLAHLPPTGPA